MTELEFTWDSRDLDVWRGAKIDKALTNTLSKAGGDAIRAMKIASSKQVRQKKRYKVSRLNKALPLTFPKSKSLDSLAWRMDVSGAPVPVIEFPHRQTRQGVSVAINAGKRALIKSAFIATMRNGHTGVFQRTSKHRLPIREAFTTRISDVFKDVGMVPAVQERAKIVFSSSFERLFSLELEKIK